ncbi:MAG: hypothetical protein HRU02_02775 [Myxococcales bacterium]|nr:hypothetical protein [Myxococcales bacterium]
MRISSRGKIGWVWVTMMVALVWSGVAFADGDSDASESKRSASDWGAIVFDVGVLRPLGAIQTGVGTVLFAVAGPLALPSDGGAGEAWDVFVRVPYEDTFQRPLGRF